MGALVFLDADRHWCKSSVGVTEEDSDIIRRFCEEMTVANNVHVVNDASEFSSFIQNQLSEAYSSIRFLAGVPLCDPDDNVVGSLIVMDRQPCHLSSEQLNSLRLVAKQVMTLLEMRLRLRESEFSDTTTALRESEKRLAMTLEHMTDAFCLLDHEWRMTFLNKEAERLILHTSEQMQNVLLWERFPPTSSSALYTEFHRAVREQVPVHFELYYPPLKYWFEIHAYPVPDGLAVYFRGINERKQVLEELRASEERFRELAETIDDVFWVWDPQKDAITYASPRYDAVFGHSREELYRDPRSFTRNIHADDMERLRAAIAKDPYSIKIDYRLIQDNGQTRWVSVSTFPVYDENGNIRHSVGIGHDITQLMETTEQLRDSEKQYRLLFTNNPHPMWVYDVDTLRFLAVNERAMAHYGFSEEEFLAMTILDIRHPEDVPRLRIALENWRPGMELGVWRHRKKDGTSIDVETFMDEMPFNGRSARLVLSHDVTARRRAEERFASRPHYWTRRKMPLWFMTLMAV
jgi:PAS domain S-box-containing protein